MFFALVIAAFVHAHPAAMPLAGAGTPTVAMTVLQRARAAAGGNALARLRSLHLHERVSLSISGEADEWDDLTTGSFLQRQSLGPLSGANGYDGKVVWAQDATGMTHATGSPADVSTAITQAYATSLSYLFTQRVPGTVAYTGEKADGGHSYIVLHAVPRGGYPLDLWFDDATYLLAREVVTIGPSRSQSIDFSDYRTIGGVVLPFHSTLNDSMGNAFTTTVVRCDPNANVVGLFAMPTSQPADFSIAAGKKSTTFPIELVNNHIFLDAKVNGKGPYRFIFDTGGQGVLNPDVAASLGVRPAGGFQVGGAGAGTVQTGFAWVPKVQLGDAVLTHQSFAVFPLGPVMQAIEGVPIDGMVGYETVARYLVTIDYAHKTMTLTMPNAGVKPAGTAVPFVFYETIPLVRGAIDGQPGTIEVDTGSRAALTLMSPFVAAHGLDKKYKSDVEGIRGFGVGGPASARVTRVKTLSIGSVVVPNVITDLSTATKGALADPSLAGNLGGTVLKRFTVTFDYRDQIMYLQKNATFDHPDTGDRSGLVLVQVPAGIRVLGVLTSTPAAQAGLQPRDIIASVNGTPAAQLGLVRIRQILSGPIGTTIRLTVTSPTGATHPALLVLKDYV